MAPVVRRLAVLCVVLGIRERDRSRFWNTPPDSATVAMPVRSRRTAHTRAVARTSPLWNLAAILPTGTSRARSLAAARTRSVPAIVTAGPSATVTGYQSRS